MTNLINSKNIRLFGKRTCLLCFALLFSIFTYAHRINGYKFFHVVEKGNLFSIEDKLNKYFKSKGFTIISSFDVDNLSSEDKSKLLIARYNVEIVHGGTSTVVLFLTDYIGQEVFKTSGYGQALTANGDVRKCMNRIFSSIDKLKYRYDPTIIKPLGLSRSKFAAWSEEEIKSYLRNKPKSSIEGIYKNYSNNLDYYSVAILKDDETYYAIIVDTENKQFRQGDTKMILSLIEGHSYDVDYFDFNGRKLHLIADYQNRFLTLKDGKEPFLQFLKIYPSRTLNSAENEAIGEEDLLSLGSGFIISGNIVATNYHVIDGANKIVVVLNRNGLQEDYNAKVLSIDKASDLALLAIKDKKFTFLPPAPYNIISNTLDVGTSIFTMGYPMADILGKDVKITDGVISSKTGYNNNAVTYQISAAIQPGNSGGALFDKKGHLVGVTNAGVPSAENVGYAIKSSYLLNLIDAAPIEIPLPEGSDVSELELPAIIKLYAPYIAVIKKY